MEKKFMHLYRVYFKVDFYGKRKRHTLIGIREVPYIFSAVDSDNICPTFIKAKNPVRARAEAEKIIKRNAQKMVSKIASKTCHGEINRLVAKDTNGNYKNSKSFSAIRGYKIQELIIV